MSKAVRFLACAASLALLAPTSALAWSKSYVVEWMEPALHYGGPEIGSADSVGSDCPNGVNQFNLFKGLVTPYRSAEQVATLLDPDNARDAEAFRVTRIFFAFRGPTTESVFENPTTIPDPGLVEVTGALAEGFDLDDNPNTGFTGLDGVKGVDNGYYKSAGCIRRYRGKVRDGATAKYHMEGMRNGNYTVLMVVSGKGDDPRNDEDVTVGVYTSKQAVVKDAGGVVAADYSFVVDTDPRFQTVFAARTRDGVLENRAPIPQFKTHDSLQVLLDDPTMVLQKARVRLRMTEDGGLEGMIGGYRNWYDYYRNIVGNSGHGDGNGRGPTQGAVTEKYGHFNVVGFYYSLRRNADGIPDAEGRNTAISAAYRYYLKPAFVVTPNAAETLTVARFVEK